MDFYLFIYFHLSVIYFEKINNPPSWKTVKTGWDKTCALLMMEIEKRFDIFSFLFFLSLKIFDIFFSFSTTLLLSLMGIVFPWAHLAREPIIDQPNYFPAPINITRCNRKDPPQHLVPFWFALMFLYFCIWIMGPFFNAVNSCLFSPILWVNSNRLAPVVQPLPTGVGPFGSFDGRSSCRCRSHLLTLCQTEGTWGHLEREFWSPPWNDIE